MRKKHKIKCIAREDFILHKHKNKFHLLEADGGLGDRVPLIPNCWMAMCSSRSCHGNQTVERGHFQMYDHCPYAAMVATEKQKVT